MSLKAPIEVRSLKAARVTVHTATAGDIATADFVSGAPRILHVVTGAVKAVFIGQHGTDLRDVNRARHGQKELEPELTAALAVGATR